MHLYRIAKTLLICIILLTGCNEGDIDSETRMNSRNIQNDLERIKLLKKEIIAPTEFSDAEFDLFNVNGFSSSKPMVPGASNWDYKFAIRSNTADLLPWTNGMFRFNKEDYDDSWTRNLIKHRAENWRTDSEPEFYLRKGSNVTLIWYRKEGIIFKRAIAN